MNPNRIAVTVGEMPVLLSGNLDRVRIAAIRKHPFPRSSRPGKIRLQLPRSCAEAVPQGEKTVPTAFRDYRKLAGTEHGGAADLAATFESSYDRENLRLTVTVTDDVFHQPESNIANAWRGDGIQLAFRTFRENGGSSRTELDAALIGGKAALFLREAQGDRSKTPECAIERQGNRTVYRVPNPGPAARRRGFRTRRHAHLRLPGQRQRRRRTQRLPHMGRRHRNHQKSGPLQSPDFQINNNRNNQS